MMRTRKIQATGADQDASEGCSDGWRAGSEESRRVSWTTSHYCSIGGGSGRGAADGQPRMGSHGIQDQVFVLVDRFGHG
jgi:hypothetical protein